ncbi:chitin deacetylase [Physocladia obscura]|uniref:Chitin deacetylase n=1 Tax=Physocladia obscura TaxID=109957 RepID=A0AAD5XAR3_9FUNG|nr:chitin deacetylase [Physocladia obscura]
MSSNFDWALELWQATPEIPVWTAFFAQAGSDLPVPDTIAQCNSGSPKTWAATFDDWPSKYILTLLESLEQYNVKSAFFSIGTCVVANPNALLATFNSGHAISLHIWSHPDLTTVSDDRIVSELVYSAKAVHEVTGQYFRAPYFSCNDRVRSIAATMGLQSVGAIGANIILSINHANGNIPPTQVHWHKMSHRYSNPGFLKPEVAIVPTVLEILVNAGFDLIPVHECVGDFNPYGNTILESFFVSGQFENTISLVESNILSTSTTSSTTTKTSEIVTTESVTSTSTTFSSSTSNSATSIALTSTLTKEEASTSAVATSDSANLLNASSNTSKILASSNFTRIVQAETL